MHFLAGMPLKYPTIAASGMTTYSAVNSDHQKQKSPGKRGFQGFSDFLERL